MAVLLLLLFAASAREGAGPAILWRNPADEQTRNLFYGPGGRQHAPRPPFTFVREDLHGNNPKFIVTHLGAALAP